MPEAVSSRKDKVWTEAGPAAIPVLSPLSPQRAPLMDRTQGSTSLLRGSKLGQSRTCLGTC